MIIDAWQTKHLWDKLRIWFMPTGWRPEDVAQLNPVNTIEDVYQYEKFTPYISSKALKLHFLNLFSLLIVIYFFFGHIADFSSYGLMSFGVFFFLQIYSASELLNGRSIGLWLGVLTSILGLYLCLFLFPKNLNQWALITYSIFLSWMLLQLIVIAYTFYSGGFNHRIAPKN
jgi:hypothetical protein